MYTRSSYYKSFNYFCSIRIVIPWNIIIVNEIIVVSGKFDTSTLAAPLSL